MVDLQKILHRGMYVSNSRYMFYFNNKKSCPMYTMMFYFLIAENGEVWNRIIMDTRIKYTKEIWTVN